jgi:hypothetical protein
MRAFQLFLRLLAGHVRHARTADGHLVCSTEDVQRWLMELSNRIGEFNNMFEFLDWFETKPSTRAEMDYAQHLKQTIRKTKGERP